MTSRERALVERIKARGHAWVVPAQYRMVRRLEFRGFVRMTETTKYTWDSAIINWYDPEAALGWHRDQAELDRSLPIVTISLGDAASWAIREGPGQPISRCRLESGDVTLLAGITRPWLHTIERIIPAPLLSPLQTRGRVSITVRVAG